LSAGDSSPSSPRTPYGHKIHLPLVDYVPDSSQHHGGGSYRSPLQEDPAEALPTLNKDDFESRLPEVPLSSLERLVRSHAIWFLPAVSREEAVSFLHAKEEGVSEFLPRSIYLFIYHTVSL
jgi:hypothetical protein